MFGKGDTPMHKPGIFAAAAVAIVGALGLLAYSTAGEPFAPPYGARIDPLPMMAQAHGLPIQRMTDLSLIFVAPAPPTAP